MIRPIKRDEAQAFVRDYHSHHPPHVGDVFRLGWREGGALKACVVAGRPIAQRLDDGETWEVTRLCVGPEAPRFAASRLLGAIGRVADAAGVELLVSYTRVDEPGTCYLAAGWTPVAVVAGRAHDTGNRAGRDRELPGLERRRAEVVDRVRWERGPRAGLLGALWLGPVVGWVALW